MKNEINYSPQKETTLGRQSGTHADLTYSISGNVISIVDLDLGKALAIWEKAYQAFPVPI